MQIEMQIAGLTIDPVNNSPIVLLREKDGSQVVPIWIGAVEASAIAFELEGVKLPRPMTHDLLKSLIESLGGEVKRVVVVDLRENTYFAIIEVEQQGRTIEIDSRPSDAIALSLRAQAPVFCDSEVIRKARIPQEKAEAEAAKAEKGPEGKESKAAKEAREAANKGPRPIVDDGTETPEDLLENLDPEDFGKYKM